MYKLFVERLNDPKRGNYEDPIEGIKGHHEMMLTTDICLVYKKNPTFMKCMNQKDEFSCPDCNGGHVYNQQ